MIILTDGKKEYQWYLDLKTLKSCANNGFRVVLYSGGCEYITSLNGMIIVREEVVKLT